MRHNAKKLIWIAPLALVAMALFVAAGGEIVRLLWNWLLPPLFGFREIGFWQGLGLLALCRILFGGFRLGRARTRIGGWRNGRWAASMTPEERERFRQDMRERCGFKASSDGGKEPAV